MEHGLGSVCMQLLLRHVFLFVDCLLASSWGLGVKWADLLHVGASLFYLDTINKLKDSTTVTGEKAYWVLPSSGATGGFEVGYHEISDIDFSKPETVKKRIDKSICGQPESPSSSSRASNKHLHLTPSEDEMGKFFEKLSFAPSKPVKQHL